MSENLTMAPASSTPELFTSWLHEERKRIDARIREVKAVIDQKPEKGIVELTLSFRALQMAKMWLGQVLGEVAGPLPPEFADKAE